MKKIAVLLLMLQVTGLTGILPAAAQDRIILKKGLKRSVLRTGMQAGVTLHGEEYDYEGWLDLCTGCRTIYCYNKVWRIDTIDTDYLVVYRVSQHDSAWIYESVPVSDGPRIREYEREWERVSDIIAKDEFEEDSVRYRKAIAFEYKQFNFDSISTLTFARNKKCRNSGLFLPTAGLVLILAAPLVSFDEEHFLVPRATGFALAGSSLLYYYMKQKKRNEPKAYNLEKWKRKVK